MKDIIGNGARRHLTGRGASDGAFDTSAGGYAFTLEANVTHERTDHTPLYTLSSGYHERIY
jgi:hypothetical protein